MSSPSVWNIARGCPSRIFVGAADVAACCRALTRATLQQWVGEVPEITGRAPTAAFADVPYRRTQSTPRRFERYLTLVGATP